MFCIFEINSKIQNGRLFWQVKCSLKLGKARLHRYPVAQKFCQNCSIWHSFQDTSKGSVCLVDIVLRNLQIQMHCSSLYARIEKPSQIKPISSPLIITIV